MLRKSPPGNSRINLLRLLVGLLAAGLSVPALAQSLPFPTYQVGANQNGSQGPDYPSTLPNPWVVSNGQIITPAGTLVYLGTTTRAKAVALNPTGNHTAAVLQMGAPQAVTIFNTQTGAVLQTYKPFGTKSGSSNGIAYTPDGLHLLFSQDSSYVAIASVSPTGLLSDFAHVSVPMDVNAEGVLSNVTCFPNSPGGTTGSILIPCGQTVSIVSDGTHTSYPLGIAISKDGKTAYVVLDNNDTLTKIDLTAATPVEGPEIRVGNVPHSVVISPDGNTAYVSNEAGRIATKKDFQGYSNGTPVVAHYPTGSTATGTVSVVDLASFKVTGSIETGLHPTGMAFWGKYLLVANAYSDSISVIDTTCNQEVRKIDLGLPIGVPGEGSAYGAGPNSIAVDPKEDVAYVALYNANAIAVVDLNNRLGVEPRHRHDPGRLCAELGCAGHRGQCAARCQRQGHRHHRLRRGNPSDEYARKFVSDQPRRLRLRYPPGPWHRQHRPRAEPLGPVDDDAAGLPEQPLGSGGKYLVGRRGQPACQAGSQSRTGSAIRRRSSTSS